MTSKRLWNWQQNDWPCFQYDEHEYVSQLHQFLEQAGSSLGIVKLVSETEKNDLIVHLLSDEALKTSEIEGEFLRRDSLQSSIRRQFGLKAPSTRNHPAENGIAEMMTHLYQEYALPLTHEILCEWHLMLMNGRFDVQVAAYRTHSEPMQVVSGSLSYPKIHFEAPPSNRVMSEMDRFIHWFNDSAPGGIAPLNPLVRAGIAHLYFVSIHPFEDGNGRVARALVQKALSQNLNRPVLLPLSGVISDHKKKYYSALENQNKHNQINDWLGYFSDVILKAQIEGLNLLEFMIQKSRLFERFEEQLNQRQIKVLKRLMDAGIKGFEGGLSADNYVRITQTSSSTATRDLKDLVKKKILFQSGELKSTRYQLAIKPS